jgi:hypothetical protein
MKHVIAIANALIAFPFIAGGWILFNQLVSYNGCMATHCLQAALPGGLLAGFVGAGIVYAINR